MQNINFQLFHTKVQKFLNNLYIPSSLIKPLISRYDGSGFKRFPTFEPDHRSKT